MESSVLRREFYDRDPAVVARELLGKLLLRETSAGLCGGRIVETEAYLSARDPACHASRGQTRRNAAMFGPPGHAYVYMIHSRWCLNAVTEPAGTPSAVLIRAIEPLIGNDLMRQRRGTEMIRDLTRGPARLCQALAIDRTYDGWDLTAGRELWIGEDLQAPELELRIAKSGRIGISSAQRRLLRFFVAGNPFVSGSTKLNRRQ
jgi:DNA-3-methyladenine glycosylase